MQSYLKSLNWILLSSAQKLTLQLEATESHLWKHVQKGTVTFSVHVVGSPSVAQWLHFPASFRKGVLSTPAEGLRFVFSYFLLLKSLFFLMNFCYFFLN